MVNYTITSLLELGNIYEQTTLILGIGSLIMSATLLVISKALQNNSSHSKLGLIFLAIAMFVLSIINLAEYVIGVDSKRELYSLSIVIFAASMELFLLFAAYMSMLCKEFITKRRIYTEIGCIVLFTAPAMFISPDNNPVLFYVLFVVGIIFYIIKFASNFLVYRKQIIKTKIIIENFLSDDSKLWLRWITNTFYVVLAIGIVTVAIPMTNLTVLAFYNIFLLFSYFYIYISVMQNISMFDSTMSMLEEGDDVESLDENSLHPDSCMKPISVGIIIPARQKYLNDWIADRGYAVTGITATEVASRLKISRSRLSLYLKNELHTTYYEWIAELRIDDAKRQLTHYPERSVYDIALSVGIEDRDNFRRVFQRYVGVSPTAYRKQHFDKKEE